MSNIRKMGRPQVIDEDILTGIEDVVRDARAGKIVDLVLVANDASGASFLRISHFSNAWHILGALEYAKSGVFRGIGDAG